MPAAVAFVRSLDAPLQREHAPLLVNAYPKPDGRPWWCEGCGHPQPATARRVFVHAEWRCTGGADSECYRGPYCASCAEAIS